jgi:hypothetical protein
MTILFITRPSVTEWYESPALQGFSATCKSCFQKPVAIGHTWSGLRVGTKMGTKNTHLWPCAFLYFFPALTFAHLARCAAAIRLRAETDIFRRGLSVVAAIAAFFTDTPWPVSPNSTKTCCSLEISARMLNCVPRVARCDRKG